MSRLGKQLTPTALVLKRPRVSEKASLLVTESKTSGGVYTFLVAAWATKPLVKEAIETFYKLTPARINIVRLPAKKIVRQGKIGWRPGLKKAMVFLKAGEKIESL